MPEFMSEPPIGPRLVFIANLPLKRVLWLTVL